MFVIKQVFKRGLSIRAVSEDPAAEVRYLSEREHERNMFLLPDMIDKLVAACEPFRFKHYMPALIYLGVEHGCSRQEALSLEWSHVNFDYDGHGLIHFYRTKNGRHRTEYLMPRTRAALLKWRDHLEFMRKRRNIKKVKSNRIFCRLDGSPKKQFVKAWLTVRAKVGLDELHFHDLRHTFCSNLLLSGADLKVVKDMIGHRDIAMTDRYSHLTTAHKRHHQERLAAHYANTDK